MWIKRKKHLTLPALGKLNRHKGFLFGTSYSWIGGVKILNDKETFIALEEK